MRKFQVTVNGNMYEVDVEEIGAGSSTNVVQAAPVKAVTAPTPKKEVAKAPVSEGGVKIVAPMPGKIVDVKVAVGQTVKEGDLVAVLEAMKMENEIFAASAGTVSAVNVAVGASVETNDIIVVLG